MKTNAEPLFDEAAADHLARRGHVVLDDLFGEATARRLRADVITLRREGRFAPARVGAGARRRPAPRVRQDWICWLDHDGQGPDPAPPDDEVRAPSPALRGFLASLEEIRGALNATCFLGLQRIECHAACYPPGGFYRPHVDAFVGRPERTISFVYFLNPGWVPAHGGELRIHAEAPLDVEPRLDRLVLFRSQDVLHEVRPVNRRRYTLTGWMSPAPRVG